VSDGAERGVQMQTMNDKAAVTREEFLFLARESARGRFANAAANRAYYCLYQALVAEFERLGRQPSDFAQPDPRHPQKWPHHVILQNCTVVGVARREKGTVEYAWELRVKADYMPAPVLEAEIASLAQAVPPLLEALGVAPRKTGGSVPQ